MTKRFIIMTGLPGVGKTQYITDSPIDEHLHLESRAFFDATRDAFGENMNHHEVTVYARALCFAAVMDAVANQVEVIVLEWPGIVRTSQAFLKTILDAVVGSDYDTKVVYMQPTDIGVFTRAKSRDGDQYAYEAANDMVNGVDRYRHANECPYFDDVDVIKVPSA